MAVFTLKKIAQLAATHQTYLRGVSCYNAGRVRHISHPVDGRYAECLAAEVASSGWDETYHVSVGFDHTGAAAHYSCTCPTFARTDGACKHIVAALVHKYYSDMVSGMTTAGELMRHGRAERSDEAAKQLIKGYLSGEESHLRAGTAGRDEPVSLQPVLHLHAAGGQPALSFSIGGIRSYVVKDLNRFFDDMSAHRSTEYGTQLTLLHHPDSFDEQSRPLLRFLMDSCADIRSHASLQMEFGRPPRLGRELPLTPAGLDRFFSLYRGQRVPLAVSGEGKRDIRLLEGTPRLSVQVAYDTARSGVTLSMLCPLFTEGGEGLYILWEGTFYRCDGEFSRRIRPFLQAMREQNSRLFLADADLNDFGAAVLPLLQDLIQWEGDTDKLFSHRPDTLETALYLDVPEPLTVTGRLEYRYGDRTLHPYQEAEAGCVRDRLREMRAQLAAEHWFTTYQPDTGLLVLHADEDAYFRFLTDGMAEFAEVADVYLSDAFRENAVLPPPKIAVGVSLSMDLLELDLDVEGIDPAELAGLLASYRRRKRYHRLRSGQFLSLADPSLAGLARIADGLSLSDRQLREGHAQVPKYRGLYLDQVMREDGGLPFRRDTAFRELVKSVKSIPDSEFTPPESLRPILRNYQRTGFRWLKTMERYGFGGILADDMGLGKTLQIISLLLDAREHGNTEPSLVVCPASLVLNWESELRRFAPSLTVLTVLGNAEQRAADIRRAGAYDVVVTSYDLLKRDIEQYAGKQFRYHVLDEAQYIKNYNTQNARAVKAIRSRQRFALTGTPIENRLSEIWSIFDFLMPGFLYSYARFREQFELPAVKGGDPEALAQLRRLCGPFILRRLKRDVLRELPPKTETVVATPMEETQRKLYLAEALQMRRELGDRFAADGAEHNRMQVLAMLTRLRQICCDPSLCFDNYTGGSAKLETCMELLREATAAGHRVLLFSQFTSMLAILEKRLKRENISYFLLQGSTPKEKRADMVERFNRPDDGAEVFLISLKAGGTGLNLTGADVVIHYDPWWNLSVQNQATDRAHRIGQRQSVQVYKLIAQSSIEEKILRLQEVKRELADAVVQEGDGILTTLSAEELLDLIG